MANDFSYLDPGKLPDIASKKIRDLDDIDLFSGSLSNADPVEVGDVEIGFKAGAEGQIQVFNGLNDIDAEGVLGVTPAEVPEDQLAPQLELTTDFGWLKYRLAANASVNAGLAVDAGSLGIGLKGSLTLASYRRHGLDEVTKDAVVADVKDFKSILSAAQIAALDAGEAVAMFTDGQLTASVSLSWADVYSTTLDSLSRALATSKALALDASVGAELTADVMIGDSFQLIFSRAEPGVLKLAVRKAEVRNINAAFSAGVTARLKDPSVLENALNTILKNLYGDLGITRLENIIAKIDYASLPAAEKSFVDKAITRLGLDGPLGQIAQLRQAFTGIQDTLRDAAGKLKGQISGTAAEINGKIDDAVEEVLDKLLRNGLVSEVDDLINQVDPDNLTDEERKLLEAILERLGLTEEFDDAEDFLDQWEALKGRAETWLKDLAAKLTGNVDALADDAEELVNRIQGAVLDNDVVTRVNEILAEADRENLVDKGAAEIDKLLTELGVKKGIDKLKELEAKWQRVKEKASATIKQVAETKISVSFGMEYALLDTRTSLLEATMADAAITDSGKGYYTSLVLGDMRPVLAGLRQATRDDRLNLIRFFDEQTIERKFGFGFTLGFGTFSMIGRSSKDVKIVKRRDVKGRQMISFSGSQSYRAKMGSDHVYATLFSAEMDDYSADQAPSDFAYKLGLTWTVDEGKLKQDRLSAFVDQMVLWGALPENTDPKSYDKLDKYLGRKVTFSSTLSFDEKATRALILSFAAIDITAWSRALGAAMSWNKQPLLNMVSSRKKIYMAPWRSYLTTKMSERFDRTDWAEAAEHYFKQNGPRALCVREKRFANSQGNSTLGSLANMNPDLVEELQRFSKAMSGLANAIANGGDFSDIQKAFNGSTAFFARSHWTRALGQYCLAKLDDRPALLDGIEAAATITSGNTVTTIGSRLLPGGIS